MTKDELRELATWGVRKKLQDIEQQLALYHDEFPELFISETRPVLLRAEPREDGKTWGLTPKPAEPRGEKIADRVLAFLAAHPPSSAVAIAQALSINDSQTIRTVLYRLQRQDRAHRDAQTGVWMVKELRDKYLALPPSPSEPVDLRTNAQRILDYLATDPTPMGVTGTMKACGAPPSSTAIYKLKKLGKVKQAADGTWTITKRGARKAAAPAGEATGSQPALPLAPTRLGPGRGRQSVRYWKEQWYVRLQTVGPERVRDTAKALGTDAGVLLSSSDRWLRTGVITKDESGFYQVGPTQPAPGALMAAPQALGSQNGAHA